MKSLNREFLVMRIISAEEKGQNYYVVAFNIQTYNLTILHLKKLDFVSLKTLLLFHNYTSLN